MKINKAANDPHKENGYLLQPVPAASLSAGTIANALKCPPLFHRSRMSSRLHGKVSCSSASAGPAVIYAPTGDFLTRLTLNRRGAEAQASINLAVPLNTKISFIRILHPYGRDAGLA